MFSKVRSQKLEVGSEKKKAKNLSSILYFLFSVFFPLSAKAQCAMCRAALESEGNQTKAQAVNDGIVYLMVIPYLLVGVLAYVIYKMYKKKSN